MGKRFSRLEYAIWGMQSTTLGAPVTVPPAGSNVEKYYKFTIGEGTMTAVQPLKETYEVITVRPFMYVVAKEWNEKITGRVNKKLTGGAGDNLGGPTIYNHIATPTNAEDAGGFVAARTIVSAAKAVGGGGSLPTKTSQITGFVYTPRTENSYTVPFGEHATAPEGEQGVAEAIGVELDKNTTPVYLWTFTPERKYKS